MAYTKEQLQSLTTQAEKFGWFQSDAFKQEVNRLQWDWAYDKLTSQLQGMQSNLQAKQTTPTPAPVAPTQTPVVPQNVQQTQQNVQQTTPTPQNIVTPQRTQTDTFLDESITWPQKQTLPKDIAEWKNAWSNLWTLKSMIDTKYGTDINVDEITWTLSWVINWEKVEWKIDDAWNPIRTSLWPAQQSSQDLFSQLRQWIALPDSLKGTTEYKEAMARLSRFNTYKWLNASQYGTLLSSWVLLPNTQLYSDLMSDPFTAQAIQQAKTINTLNTSINPKKQIEDTENNQSENILNSNLTVKSALADNEISMAEFKALTTSPEITAKQAEMEEVRDKYIELKNEWDNIEDSIRKQYEWTGVTSWFLAAKIARAQKDLYKPLSLAQSRYEAVMWDLSSMKQEATALLNTNLWLYKEAQAYERQLEAEQRQRGFQLDTMLTQRDWQMQDRDFALTQQANQLAQQYDFTYWDINSQDPRIRNIALQNWVDDVYSMYEQAWLIPPLSRAEMSEQVSRALEQGQSLWQALTSLSRGIQQTSSSIWDTGWSSTWFSWWFQDLTNLLKRPAWSKNVWQDTNNPWNIMAESPRGIEYAKSLWAIWFYTSPNGRTYAVFPDMETWLNATKKDIESKLSGWSSWVTEKTTLWQLASWWTVWPNAPIDENAVKNFERLTWVNRNTLIKDINKDTLINAIVRNEWVDINRSTDLSYLQWTWSYTASQKAIMDAFLEKPTDTKSMEALQRAWLTTRDIDNYASTRIPDFDMKEYEWVRQKVTNNTQVGQAATTVVRDFTWALWLLDEVFASWEWILSATARRAEAKIPGTKAYDLQKLIDSAKSNIWIDQLLAIKASGAWLWAVPQSQLETLQSVLGNLDIWRSPELLKRDMEQAIEQYNNVIRRTKQENDFFKTQFPQYEQLLFAEIQSPTQPEWDIMSRIQQIRGQ